MLKTIPGIGDKTATTILAECGDLRTYPSARELAAYAGLTPKEFRSGSSVKGKPRLSKIGSSRLRQALYFPAISAKRYNPIIQAFCDRLLQRGKHNMTVIGAAMRKLLHLAYGVVKSGKPFDANHLNPQAVSLDFQDGIFILYFTTPASTIARYTFSGRYGGSPGRTPTAS